MRTVVLLLFFCVLLLLLPPSHEETKSIKATNVGRGGKNWPPAEFEVKVEGEEENGGSNGTDVAKKGGNEEEKEEDDKDRFVRFSTVFAFIGVAIVVTIVFTVWRFVSDRKMRKWEKERAKAAEEARQAQTTERLEMAIEARMVEAQIAEERKMADEINATVWAES